VPEPAPASALQLDGGVAGGRLLDKVAVRRLFDIPFSDVTRDEFFALIDEQIRMREFGYVVTPNVDHICRFHRDVSYRDACPTARLVLCDGTPIIWASHLLGRPLRGKLSGSDLVVWLSGHAAERGYSVFFFGAQAGVGARAAERLKQQFPGLKVAGVLSPPWGFEDDPELRAEAVRTVKEAAPDIVYVALGSPKQELWMKDFGPACGAPVMLGIGGSFDFVSGRIRRAPQWIQSSGLEWLWRLCQEPRRLWHRYLVEDLLIFKLFWKELVATFGPRRKQG